ncbi:MAG: GDSL-type esterase/lipase family protein [Ruminococcus sp.]|nr:GDSL-type esterase/lipase family protein [Ruminococcus sp.]
MGKHEKFSKGTTDIPMKKSTVTMVCIIILFFAVIISFALQGENGTLLNGFGLKATTAELSIGDYSGYFTTESESLAYIVDSDITLETETDVTYSANTLTFEPSSTFVKPIGRTVYQSGERWMSMSGSGIEFNCDANAVEITLLSENNAYITNNHKPRVAIFADDCLVYDICLEKNETTIHVDLERFLGKTTVSVVKLSESMHSSCGIGQIKVFGENEISPTAQKPFKIEFIGDSITCGFGIDEPRRNAGFSTRTENFAKSYAYITSKMLGADYSAVAFAGYGVASGYTTSGRRNEDATIFKYYDKAITNKQFDETDLISDEWNSDDYVPNLVVINLGTNDASYCKTIERRAVFVSEYKRLITLVREKNPDAYILCVLGDMNNSLFPSIETAIDEYVIETADSKISSTKIDFKMGENPVVISGHPGAESNYIAAKDLADEIMNLRYAGKI